MDGEDPMPEAAQAVAGNVVNPDAVPEVTNAPDLTAPDVGAPAVGEDGLPLPPGEPEKTNIPEEVMADMKALWDVFDMEETNHVSTDELRVLMRALDIDLDREGLAVT